MMSTLKRTLLVVMTVGILFCAGCAPSGSGAVKAEEPPRKEVMVDLIGKTKEEVLTNLCLEETDLTEFSLNTYLTPLSISYASVSLRIMLQFGPVENVLGGITYMAEYHGEPERAAKEMLAVAKQIQAALGKPDEGSSSPAWEMTESEIVTAITTQNHLERLSKQHSWYLDPVSNHMEDYINELVQTPLYQGYQNLDMKPGYQCQLVLSAYEDGVTAYLLLNYNITTVPS